ncbi:hypothetical protein G9A89_022330 [Geosiphon pyriformis]|nr:hypothetical protein G9A89_022330 [Geosiphon pyriformis]
MSNTVVSNVYRGVIDDVIQNVKKDFEEMGVDESILSELKRSWEHKVVSTNAATWDLGDNFYQERYSHDSTDLNSTFNGTNKSTKYNQGVPAAHLSALAVGDMLHTDNGNNGMGKPQPQLIPKPENNNVIKSEPNRAYMTSASLTSTNNLTIGTPNARLTGQITASQQTLKSEDKKIYLQEPIEPFKIFDLHNPAESPRKIEQQGQLLPRSATPVNYNHMGSVHVPVAQTPEIPGTRATYSISTPAPLSDQKIEPAAKKRKIMSRDFLDDDIINSDLDDSDEEDANAEGEDTQNIVLCLYDKVTRTKNKWKCVLKDGIMSANGKDYLFNKGNGEFSF